MEYTLNYNQTHLQGILKQAKQATILSVIVLAVTYFFHLKQVSIFSYIFMMNAFYFIGYFYKKHYQYITVKGKTLKKNSIFGSSVILDEVVDIKKFHDEYYLVTSKKKWYVDVSLLDKESKEKMLEIIEQLSNN